MVAKPVLLEIAEPIVGGGLERGRFDDARRNEIEIAEAEIIARIERSIADEQHGLRLFAPLSGCELQVALQREGAAFAVIEGVEELVHGDDVHFVLLRFAQADQRSERGRKIRMRDDDDVGAGALLLRANFADGK